MTQIFFASQCILKKYPCSSVTSVVNIFLPRISRITLIRKTAEEGRKAGNFQMHFPEFLPSSALLNLIPNLRHLRNLRMYFLLRTGLGEDLVDDAAGFDAGEARVEALRLDRELH